MRYNPHLEVKEGLNKYYIGFKKGRFNGYRWWRSLGSRFS